MGDDLLDFMSSLPSKNRSKGACGGCVYYELVLSRKALLPQTLRWKSRNQKLTSGLMDSALVPNFTVIV